MECISKHQLFSLIMLFEIGSTTLFALGIKAKQDAWIVIFVAMLFGFFWLWIYTELQKNFLGKNLAEIIILLLGKPIGIPLILLYAQYFIYISIQNYTEFGELIKLTSLTYTPRFVILIIFMLVIVYILFLGLEVLARTAEIMLPITIFFTASAYIMIFFSGRVELQELMPILANGITSDAIVEVFHVMEFPFGEMVVFLMYWRYVNSQEVIRTTSLLAVGMAGLLLCTSIMIIISVLGVNYASVATIPLLEVIRVIDIANILTNLDILGVFQILLGGFYKMTIFFYGGVLSICTLCNNKYRRWIIAILGVFVLIYGNNLIVSFPFHRWLGENVNSNYIHPPFEFLIPALLIIIFWLKKINHTIKVVDKKG